MRGHDARILEPALEHHPNVAPVTVPVVRPLREQDPKPAAAQGSVQRLDGDRRADGRLQGRDGRAQTLEVLGKGIEQRGAQHIAGDAADRIEKQMQPLAGHRALLPLLRPRTP